MPDAPRRHHRRLSQLQHQVADVARPDVLQHHRAQRRQHVTPQAREIIGPRRQAELLAVSDPTIGVTRDGDGPLRLPACLVVVRSLRGDLIFEPLQEAPCLGFVARAVGRGTSLPLAALVFVARRSSNLSHRGCPLPSPIPRQTASARFVPESDWRRWAMSPRPVRKP